MPGGFCRQGDRRHQRPGRQFDAAMKTVGLTHLTAVSGANCSLILGSLHLAARNLRFGRALGRPSRPWRARACSC